MAHFILNDTKQEILFTNDDCYYDFLLLHVTATAVLPTTYSVVIKIYF